ncbi:hypothetical protein D3C78_1830050 [compost metagenome]
MIGSAGKSAWLAGEPMASKNDLGDGEVPGRPTMKQLDRETIRVALSMNES